MGRRAAGWRVRKRIDGIFEVNFTHEGVRYQLSTGTRDPGEAAEAAKALYNEVITGRRGRGRVRGRRAFSSETFAAVCAGWLADMSATLDPDTQVLYEQTYVGAHWLPFFRTLDRLTDRVVEDYWRYRLRSVSRSTVLKELAALRGLLRWAHEHGHIAFVPAVKSPPRTSTGRPRYNRKPIAITAAEQRAVIAQLPERVRTGRSVGYPCKARFVVSWETGLRPGTIDRLCVPANYRKGAKVLTLLEEDDKGRYEREVPLTVAARRALDSVVPEVGLIFGHHDYRTGLRAAAQRAGLPAERAAKLTVQCFRHSRITYLCERAGDNLPGIQFLVGHKRLSTTAGYAKASQRAAEDVLRRLR